MNRASLYKPHLANPDIKAGDQDTHHGNHSTDVKPYDKFAIENYPPSPPRVITTGEIEPGALVCKKLKAMYFEDVPFHKCYMAVADAFTHLKQRVRVYYPDKTTPEIIELILGMTRGDVRDFMNGYFEKDGK